ncbi:hypothetical protein [Vibrio parahaemolyticus]|uniref:hypothetical protein n=1 Tax=Vibrio parahaemolyticus TaxID=670 RepID=UPI003D813A1F
MQYGEPIIEFPFDYDEFDGAVEHTELTDIDRAVGSFFQMILDSLVVVDGNRKENEEFARFVSRERQTKLYAGEFLTPQDFLTKLTAKTGEQVKSKRNELLPVAYITRDPVVGFSEGSEYIDVTAAAMLTNAATGEKYAQVNKSFVRLTYIITTLAWSKSTLSRMALGLMMWTRHKKHGRKHVFQAETQLAGSPVQVNIELTGMLDTMAEPAEIDHESTRLYASTLRFEVISEIYEAESMSVKQGRVEIGEGKLYE